MNKLEKAIEYFKNMIENTEARKEKDPVKKAICAQVISNAKMAEIALQEKLEREQGCEFCIMRSTGTGEVITPEVGVIIGLRNENELIININGTHCVVMRKIPHCPMCGRKLEGNENKQ